MTSHQPERALSANEEAILKRIVEAQSPGAGALIHQISSLKVVEASSMATFLDFRLSREAERACLPDGPLDAGADVFAANQDLIGEILVWVVDGVLSGLEFAWYVDVPPEGLPLVDQIQVRR